MEDYKSQIGIAAQILTKENSPPTEFKSSSFGTIFLKPFSVADREKIEVQGDAENSTHNHRISVAVLHSVSDENGNKVFQESDLELLKQKDAYAVEEIFWEIVKINKLNDEKNSGND